MSLNEGSIAVIAKGNLVSLSSSGKKSTFLPTVMGLQSLPWCERAETQAVKTQDTNPR